MQGLKHYVYDSRQLAERKEYVFSKRKRRFAEGKLQFHRKRLVVRAFYLVTAMPKEETKNLVQTEFCCVCTNPEHIMLFRKKKQS
jgi:hypothetical protein